MNIGIALPSFGDFADTGLLRDIIQRAEDLNYYSIFAADHNLIDKDHWSSEFPARWFEPFGVVGYAAALTRRIKIGIAVVVVPYRPAGITAKAVATADQLTNGRFLFGVGPGYMKREFEGLNVPFESRGEMTDEYLRAMKELWTSPDPSFDGKYVRFSNVKMEPKPVQKPHPPIFVGGNTQAAMRRTALLGNAWHPVSLTPDELSTGMASIRQMAKAAGRNDHILFSTQGFQMRITDVPKGQKPMTKNGKRLPLNGTAEEIVSDFREFKRVGVEHILLRFHRVQDASGYLAAFDFFQKEIRPAIG